MKDALTIAIGSNTPVILIGPPGVGKTSTIYALAKASGAHLETVIASLRDPTDFGGLPIKVIKDQKPEVFLAPPAWAKNLVEAAKKGRPAWLFIDEISTAAPATQAALLRVILDKVCGDLTLSPETRMIAAANPPDQAAGGWDLSPPLANRFFHLPWNTTAAEWTDGLVAGWPTPPAIRIPPNWENSIPKYRALIAGYIRSAGTSALIEVPKDDAKAGGPWPSPRTWTMAARLMAYRDAAGLDEDLDTILLRGSVGDGQAIAFLEWVKRQDLPDPEHLLAHPDEFDIIPDRGDINYTILSSVVGAAIANLTPQRWEAAWKILKIAGEKGAIDVGAAAARALAAHHNPKLPPAHEYVKPYVPMLVEAGLIKTGGRR